MLMHYSNVTTSTTATSRQENIKSSDIPTEGPQKRNDIEEIYKRCSAPYCGCSQACPREDGSYYLYHHVVNSFSVVLANSQLE